MGSMNKFPKEFESEKSKLPVELQEELDTVYNLTYDTEENVMRVSRLLALLNDCELSEREEQKMQIILVQVPGLTTVLKNLEVNMPTTQERLDEMYSTLDYIEHEFYYNPDIARTIAKLEENIRLLERLIQTEKSLTPED